MSCTTCEHPEKTLKMEGDWFKCGCGVHMSMQDGIFVYVTDPKKKHVNIPVISSPKYKQDVYTTSYWNFVNAVDEEKQEYWFNQMLAQVDSDFDWSWISDRKTRNTLTLDNILQGFQIAIVFFLCVGLPIMACLGVFGN